MTVLSVSANQGTLVFDTGTPLLNVAIVSQLEAIDFRSMYFMGAEGFGLMDGVHRVPTSVRLVTQTMKLMGVECSEVNLDSELIDSPVIDNEFYEELGLDNKSDGMSLSDEIINRLMEVSPLHKGVFSRSTAKSVTLEWTVSDSSNDDSCIDSLHPHLANTYGEQSIVCLFEHNPDGRSTDEGVIVAGVVIIKGMYCPVVYLLGCADLEDYLVEPIGSYRYYSQALDVLFKKLNVAAKSIDSDDYFSEDDYYDISNEVNDDYFKKVVALGFDNRSSGNNNLEKLKSLAAMLEAKKKHLIVNDLNDHIILPSKQYLSHLKSVPYLSHIKWVEG